MTDDSREIDAIEADNSPGAKLLAEKDAQIEAQKQSLLNSWSYCESLLKDAERYHWLRSRMLAADFDYNGGGTEALVFEMPNGLRYGADCDATIDAAMAASAVVGDV